MKIEESNDGDVTILRAHGEIDLHVSPELRERLSALNAAGTSALLVDFGGVSYIDSSGLATLVEYVRESKQRGGRLALFGLQPKVQMVFELVRLNELFAIEADEASARDAVK